MNGDTITFTERQLSEFLRFLVRDSYMDGNGIARVLAKSNLPADIEKKVLRILQDTFNGDANR